MVTYPYRELADDPSGSPRPILDLDVGSDGARMRCLADTGAMNSLLPVWIADLAGIEVSGAPEVRVGVGGSLVTARFVPTLLAIGGYSWEAEVGFCDPWPRGWGLLGQRSFFRHFTVTFRTADFELDLTPIDG